MNFTPKLLAAMIISGLFVLSHTASAEETSKLDQLQTDGKKIANSLISKAKSAFEKTVDTIHEKTERAATHPKNVILIIGDGMDDQQITIARNYLSGPAGQLNLDKMPYRGVVQVLTIDDKDAKTPIYVADSANSATAIATGVTTSRGRIGTSAKDDEALTTIVEMAESAGYKTGLVSTASVTDATPAAFAAHINFRFCENPSIMINEERGYDCNHYQKSNGGIGSISEQLATSNLDVLLGGGNMHFEANVEDNSQTISALAQASGFTILKSQTELATSSPSDRILGLFAEKHLTTKLRGEGGRTAEKPEPSLLNQIHWSQGDVELPEPMTCEANPDYQDTPPLVMMTERAIAHLEHENETGFFLMVESASIDKQSHARNPCGSIGELDQLDATTRLALDYAKTHPDTLVLVTADHGHAAQIVPNNSLFSSYGVPIFTPGSLVRLNVPSGGIMAINYATNDFYVEEHSGVAVPLYANKQLEHNNNMITQAEVFGLLTGHLNLK